MKNLSQSFWKFSIVFTAKNDSVDDLKGTIYHLIF